MGRRTEEDGFYVFMTESLDCSSTSDMFKTIVTGSTRLLSHAAPLRTSAAKAVPDLAPLKFDSNGSSSLYAICKIHNMPYLVSKGDRLVLPYKMKNVKVGDVLKLNNVTSIGSRNFTFNDDNGIPESAFELTATLAEITREPKYQVYKKKQRCRRLKTVDVEPYQTHLVISELKLK
ncbi:Ribosomal prokaryotic L21 family protein [Clavispora lusitaniae]|nr:Ribosomal prokaryotic L21 family protein [Clavispora lusitaniae]